MGGWDELEAGFIGNPNTKLDERGRLKMPTEFKTFIEKKYGIGFNSFYITSQEGDTAEIYPMPEWVKRKTKILRMPQSLEERDMIMDADNLYGGKADMDPQGRLLVPEELRAAAELSGEVKVYGAGQYLRVISLEKLRQRVQAKKFLPQHKDTLKSYDV